MFVNFLSTKFFDSFGSGSRLNNESLRSNDANDDLIVRRFSARCKTKNVFYFFGDTSRKNSG